MDLKLGDFAGDIREVKANRFEIRRASARCVIWYKDATNNRAFAYIS